MLNVIYIAVDVSDDVSYYNGRKFLEVTNNSNPEINGSNENVIQM